MPETRDNSEKSSPASLAGKVMTVTGAIAANAMGVTLPHEHVLVRHTSPMIVLDDVGLMAAEVARFAAAGGHTIVEVTNRGIHRDPAGLRHIAKTTGVNIVMGTGYYKYRWHPPNMDTKTVDTITAEIVGDIVDGVNEREEQSHGSRGRSLSSPRHTGDALKSERPLDPSGAVRVRAGVIGELGVSEFLHPNEAKVVIAGAHAQRQTGTAINLHIHLVDKTAEERLRMQVLDLLEREGADLNRVVMSHCEPGLAAVDYHERLARRGVYVEYDLFGGAILRGPEIPKYEDESAAIRELGQRGFLSRLLLSQDVCFAKMLVANGGWGYAHILNDVLPRFRHHGVSEPEIYAMTVENPRRVFPLAPRTAA